MSISNFVKEYNSQFATLLNTIQVTDAKGNALTYEQGIEKSVELLLALHANNKKLMLVGNGGSAGITSHMALDFWKNAKIKATAFNDSSLLTALANDYSFEEVFAKPVEVFGETNDVLMAISSSGNSMNIVKAADAAICKDIHVITFSGFSTDNKLFGKGEVNFFVNSASYGIVETMHAFIIHCILDAKLFCNDKVNIFQKNLPL